MKTQNIVIAGISFTPCEQEILGLMVKGLSRKEIAATLKKAETTVHSQINLIFHKLHIHKNTELVAWALRNGFDAQGDFLPMAA